LARDGIKLNVTALLTVDQVWEVAAVLDADVPAIVSVFAGRIADTGVDPLPIMKESLQVLKSRPQAKLLWASPRELLNLVQADQMGCHVITVTPDILKKLPLARLSGWCGRRMIGSGCLILSLRLCGL
jgi:transaldolase